MQGTRKGGSQGIGRGISRNIAVFSRANSTESTELPLFVEQPYTYRTFSTRAMISLFVSSPIKGCKLLVSAIRLLNGFHQATNIEQIVAWPNLFLRNSSWMVFRLSTTLRTFRFVTLHVTLNFAVYFFGITTLLYLYSYRCWCNDTTKGYTETEDYWLKKGIRDTIDKAESNYDGDYEKNIANVLNESISSCKQP